MILHQKELNSVNMIIRSQGLSAMGSRHFSSWLKDSEAHHGINWLVARLKAAVSALLNDDFQSFRLGKDGLMKGPLKQLHKLFLTSRRGRTRCLRILKIYGRWEAKPAVEADFRKFAKSVDPKTLICDELLTVNVSKEDIKQSSRISRRSKFTTLLPNSDSKVVPFTNRIEADVKASDHYEILLDYCPNLVREHRNIFDCVYKVNAFDDTAHGMVSDNTSMKYDVVGKVVCLTKDRGMKHRFIANPHRLVQIALSRLQSASASYLRTLPESLVFNQEAAVPWIQQQLATGRKIWSLDLSAATDHFPLELQTQLLGKLFPDLEMDINLWKDVSRSLWETPYYDTDIRYTRGQPMGTAPSFAVFTLSHILLVRSLGGNVDNFRVIGDDIVISDPKLAKAYEERMTALNVVINKTKSLTCKSFAEFAGRLIDKHGIYHVYKASPLDVKKDPVGFLRQYGLSSLSLIPKKVREKILFFASIPGISNVPNVIDPAMLDKIDSVDFVSIVDFIEGKDPLDWDCTRFEKLALQSPPTKFELAQTGDGLGGSFTELENNKVLVEHLNSNEQIGNCSDVLDQLRDSVTRGRGVPGYEDLGVKFPISYVTKVFKKLNTTAG